MPRKKKACEATKKRCDYSEESLRSAVRACSENPGISISTASRDYGVPRKTLSDHLKRFQEGKSCIYGSLPIFTKEQEDELEARVVSLCHSGFPVSVTKFRLTS
jgi:transposase-like protein